MVREVNDDTFDSEVLAYNGTVVVDFWAPWCMPCRVVSPIVEELSNEVTSVKFAKINMDENPRVAYEYGIRSIPTFIKFSKGKVANVLVGAANKERFEEWVSS